MSIDLKNFFTIFLDNKILDTLEKAQNYLKQYRNTKYNSYSLSESRVLNMSLLLYRFKDEMSTGPIFFDIIRNMILAILQNDNNKNVLINKYLTEFEIWKSSDLDNLILEIAGIYYNLLETKKSIMINENTAIEWIPHIDSMIKKIEEHCKLINILDKVKSVINNFENKKSEIVFSILNKVYWDKIEEDLQKNDLTLFYRNMDELKNNIISLLPKSDKNSLKTLHDYFDLEYIKQLINHNIYSKENLMSLYNYLMNTLQKWDSAEFVKIYDNDRNTTIELIQTMDLNKSIRICMEQICILTENFKNRKLLWEKILNNNTEKK
jgi:hypothetical protein